jgi:cysteine-rich repeat protein
MNGYACVGGTLTSKDVCSEVCPDLYITESQACEDGNNVAGDGCYNCQPELGWACTNTDETSLTNVCTPICGDGIIIGGETCDAGANPGCMSDCSNNEYGWTCI